jgi:hypothetical protein
MACIDENKRLFDTHSTQLDKRERLAERQKECLDNLETYGKELLIENTVVEQQREKFNREYTNFVRLTEEIAEVDYRQNMMASSKSVVTRRQFASIILQIRIFPLIKVHTNCLHFTTCMD